MTQDMPIESEGLSSEPSRYDFLRETSTSKQVIFISSKNIKTKKFPYLMKGLSLFLKPLTV